MGSSLVVCSVCNVHLRRSEVACPHCGAPRRSTFASAAPLLMGIALAGCPADDDPVEDGDSSADSLDFGENSAYGTPDTGFSDVGEESTTGSSSDAGDSTGASSSDGSSGDPDGDTTLADSTAGSDSGSGTDSGSGSDDGSGSDSGSSSSGG